MSSQSDSPDTASYSVAEGSFVGRVGELSALVDGLDVALGGQGRLFLVTGEPGIGKTRVAVEFAAEARDRNALVLWGRCWDATGAPAYWPWVQMFRSLLRSAEPDVLLEMMGPGGSDVAQMVPEIQVMFPKLPGLPSRDPESERFQLFDSAMTFLKRAAEAQPILLVLDDLHAADKPSLLFLRFVAGQLADCRIVIVATYRDAELTSAHPLTALASEMVREPTTSEIRLSSFGEAEISAFVEAAMKTRPEPTLVSKLRHDTTGNPLFLEQAVRLLLAEGRFEDFSDPGLLHLPVPARISDLIGRRVGHTSEPCRVVLGVGSVLGSGFSFEVLRRLGGYSSEQLLDILDEAVEAGLLVTTAESPARFRYSHDLVRETLYEALTQAERVRLHRTAALILEDIYGEDIDSRLAELAHHYFEAAPGGAVDKAVGYARRAGNQAAESLAYEEAARLHRMALTALELQGGADESSRVEILLDLGDARTRAGDDMSAKEVFLRASNIARRTGEATQLARAAFGYGGIFLFHRAGADRDLVPLLQDALMMLGGADDHLRIRLLARLACALRGAPDRGKSDALSNEAVKTARELDDPATQCYALEGRIAATMWPENPRERLGLARELIALAEHNDQLEHAVSGRMFEVEALCELGLMGETRAAVDALARGAQTLRQPRQQVIAEINRSHIELMDGHFAEAETRILAILDAGHSSRDEASSVRNHLFLLRREQGRLAEMETFVRSSVERFPWYPLHRAALVCLLADLGRQDEALQLFHEISSNGFSLFSQDNEWLLGLALASDGCAQLEESETAGILYDKLLPFAGRHAFGARGVWVP